ERLVDEVVIFIAPKLIGGGALSVRGKGVANIKDAVGISHMTFEQCGDDILVRGRTCFPD
ncbi:MAG: dihydrofolate reductase family protein, partial [Candidatus Omnitrophica bacterium]|nr:dihydrofolate reductase family protein [Candidatus Omnitrophota bacterium]